MDGIQLSLFGKTCPEPSLHTKEKTSDAYLKNSLKVAGGGYTVPRPDKGKWRPAGEILGDGFSVAWRQLDAQYWGVPQRRKRIYLVADFAGGRASKILFEREGLRGHPSTGGTPGQGAAADAPGSTGGSRGIERLNPWDAQTIRQYAIDGVFPALGAKARSIGASETVSPTLGSEAGGNSVPSVCYPQIARTLTADNGTPCIDRGQNVVCYDARGNGGQSLNCTPSVLTSGKPPRKYIIRRLTPLECCRLQGFPDGWGVPAHKDKLSDEELAFWQGVRDTCSLIAGKPSKKYSAETLTKWYNALHTDSAEYKMWGNGIALPCAAFVLGGVAEALMEGNQK